MAKQSQWPGLSGSRWAKRASGRARFPVCLVCPFTRFMSPCAARSWAKFCKTNSTETTVPMFGGSNVVHWNDPASGAGKGVGVLTGTKYKPTPPAADATTQLKELSDWMDLHGIARPTVFLGMECPSMSGTKELCPIKLDISTFDETFSIARWKNSTASMHMSLKSRNR